MPRERGYTFENNFGNGLVTQASGLNFPQNAVVDCDNCDFGLLGEISRRLPFDIENVPSTLTAVATDSVICNYVWKNVAGSGSLTLYVAQIGETLYFYRQTENSLSSGYITGGDVDLTDYSPSAAPSPALNECSFAAGLGYLFVTHPNLEPFYVSFDPDTNTVTPTQITVQIRDLFGLDDGLAVDERPGSLDDEHDYNLRNQGWFTTSRRDDFHTAAGAYPSNADVWWTYKNVDDQFDVAQIEHVERGTTPAPRGHYILDAFQQDRTEASGVGSFDVVTTGALRPTVCAFYAGRVFYAGTASSGWESRVLFSQIVEKVEQFGHCYTQNDPTSETLFDVVPSDGGYFSVPGAGVIHALVPIAQYLLIFAANGVWALSGSTGVGFATTDFKIDQISKIGTIGNKSFVDVRGFPVYWTVDGIYSITSSPDGWQVKNITNDKIRSFYLSIPLQCRLYARGAFNPETDIIQWMYSSEEAGGLTDIYRFDRLLVLNVRTGAFSPWSVDLASGVYLHSVLLSGSAQNIAEESIVTDGGVTVTDGGDPVTVLETTTSFGASGFRYYFSYFDNTDEKFSFATQNQTRYNYSDWGFTNPTSFDSFFVSGYRLKTQGARPFTSHYMFVYTDVTEEDIEYSVRSRWDFANTAGSARWSGPQTIRGSVGDFDVVRKKLLIRGQGTVCQFEVISAAEKGFNILGWSTYDTANQDI